MDIFTLKIARAILLDMTHLEGIWADAFVRKFSCIILCIAQISFKMSVALRLSYDKVFYRVTLEDLEY